MSKRRSVFGKRTARSTPAVAGVLLGCAVAVLVVAFAGAAVGQRSAEQAQAVFDVTHLPPLLRLRSEPVRLSYDVHCAPEGEEDPERGCAVEGTAFLRARSRGPFHPVPLEPVSNDGLPRLVATVPLELTRGDAALEYYAELRSHDGAGHVVVPAGGGSAPYRSFELDHPTTVDLGAHTFGSGVRTGARVVTAPWGEDSQSVGLEPGHTLPPAGASAFDVGADGAVLLLDQANGRVLRWSPSGTSRPPVSLAIDRRLADVALAEDGSIYVLESVAEPGRNPLVRHFDGFGRTLDAVETAERTPAKLAIGPDGPVVLQRPSHQWMPAAEANRPVSPADQRRKGRSGRPLPGGGEAVVLRRDGEILIALVVNGRVRESWRVTSETPLAEVQLAEPVAHRLVLVVRTYTDTTDEFVVLVLDRKGIVTRFATPTDEWAEAAAGRFRLSGDRLYRLGSTARGAFIDRYDLGGAR
jgi:hypothetical protein